MKSILVAAAAAGLMVAGIHAQEGKTDKEKERAHEFKPQKEHEWLRQFEGTWDAHGAMKDHKGVELKSKGTETTRIALGGYWLMMEFQGDLNGKPFEGHGMIGFDPGRGKYVSTWSSSCSPCFTTAEGEADPTGKILSFNSEAYDPKTGKLIQSRMVHELRDRESRKLTFYMPKEDGKGEQVTGEILYTRK